MSDGLTIRWTLDRRQLASTIVKAAAGEGLEDAAEHLLEHSNRTVPLEESTLQGTGTTDVDKKALQAAVSYDGPYARRQHEDTRLKHDPGRRAKWLQLTLQERSTAVLKFMGDRIRRVT